MDDPFLEHHIADKLILRLIAKWLRVGITENGRATRSERGVPQGAVISPLLQTSTCTTVRQEKPDASSGRNSRLGKGNEPPHRELSLGLMEATT